MGDGSRDVPGADRAEAARAGLRGRRVALGLVIVVSVVFIGASAWQIIPAVFGAGVTPLPSAAPGSPEHECAVGIHALLGALDRAADPLSPPAAGGGDGASAGRERPSREWDGARAVATTCSRTTEGRQAWAALERLRAAEERIARDGQAAVEPLRVEVAAHLPPDLR